MISRTREQAAATEPQVDTGDTGSVDAADLAALEDLYVRHTPDVDRSDGYRPALAAAARSHLQLARNRSPGQELIRVRPGAKEAAAEGRPLRPRVGRRDHHRRHALPRRVGPRVGPSRRRRRPARRAPHRRRPAGTGRRAGDVLSDADPADPPPGALAESWIHLDLVGAAPAGLDTDLAGVLGDVREVVHDAPAMARQAIGVGDRLLADGLFGDGQPAGEPSDTSSAGTWRTCCGGSPTGTSRSSATAISRPSADGSSPRAAGSACCATPAALSRT